MNATRTLATALAVSLLAACSSTTYLKETTPERTLQRVTIIGTTDVHGSFGGKEQRLADGQILRQGGLDVFAGYVNNLRQSGVSSVIVVDSGDVFQGTVESNLFEGEPMVLAYNQIGYTAAALGNHEFDYGPVGPVAVVRDPAKENPFGALERNIGLAHFPFLAANVRDRTTGLRPSWLRPSTLVSAAGVTVGIIGLSTVSTPITTAPANVASLVFDDPVAVTIAEARDLRLRGADVIIVIAHSGGRCTDLSNENDLSSCDPDQEAFRTVNQLPPGTIDAWFGGHTHSEVHQIVNGVPVLQAGPNGRSFSVLDLEVDIERNLVTGRRLRLPVRVCGDIIVETGDCDERAKLSAPAVLTTPTFEGKPVVADAAVAGVITPFLAQASERKGQPLGIRLEGEFLQASDRESTLGNLMADALLAATPGATIAVLNSGGLRAPLRASNPNFGDIYSVIPFDNAVAVLDLTGQELRHLVRLGTNGKHGILQVSGLSITLARDRSEDRVRSLTLSDGRSIDDSKMYRVVTSDFLAAGGDGLEAVMSSLPAERRQIVFDTLMRDAVIAGLQKLSAAGPVGPKTDDGRVRIGD